MPVLATTPTGYSGASAIAQIRAYANEPTFPVDQTVLNFLNKAVEEVVRQIGGIRLWAPYPTVPLQTTIQLNNDILEIVSANFSMGNANSQNSGSASPFAQGTLVYPMIQLDQAGFMDAAAGFPAVGFGPPQAYFIYEDQGLAPTLPLAPPLVPAFSIVSNTQVFLSWNVVGSNWNQKDWWTSASVGTVEFGLTYVNADGETTLGPIIDVTLQLGQAVEVFSPPAEGNATGYNVYAGNPGGPYYLQNPVGQPIALGAQFVIPAPFGLVGPNPPTTNTTGGTSGGGTLFMQLYPAAMLGQVNIYYKARPTLWADNTSTSYTNLDTSLQEAAVVFATGRVLTNRGRAIEWLKIWKPEYDALVADMRDSANRRTQPKSGQTRDVYNRAYPNAPWWAP